MRGKKLSVKERRIKIEADKIERRKVFAELCKHVEDGYSMDCFSALSITSIKEFLERFPNEFIEEELQNSVRKAKTYWEDLGKRQARGDCLGNSRSWYYNMVNRYGWREKVEIEAEHKGQLSINVVSYATQKASKDT